MRRHHGYASYEVEGFLVKDGRMVGNVKMRLARALGRDIKPFFLVLIVLVKKKFGAHLGVDPARQDDFRVPVGGRVGHRG